MWLIIGYGNSLRSDDRFGLEVVQALNRSGIEKLARILGVHQLTPELAEYISDSDEVIFVDVSAKLSAGVLSCNELNAADTDDQLLNSSSLSHHLTPQVLLANAKYLYGQDKHGWLYTVGGENFGLGETLSASVSQMVTPVVTMILNQLKKGTTCGFVNTSVNEKV